MNQEKEQWLKHKFLTYKDGNLLFGEEHVEELAKTHKTPLYIVNEDVIIERFQTLQNVLKERYSKVRIHYAVKANTNMAVLKILQKQGAFVDVVSAGEVFACLEAGFAPDHILYTGNNWTDEELQYALDKKIMLNLDAISHIKRLANLCKERKEELPTLSFRINPEFGGGHHDHCITAGKDIKFGIFEPQVLEAYQIAIDHGFTKFGAHMHIGSGVLDIEPFQKALKKYFEIIESVVKEKKIKFEFIDFGGGIGIPYTLDAKPLDLNLYADTLLGGFKEKCKELGLGEPVFAIEPGRYLSCESTILIAKVNTYKDTGFKIFIGIDAGFNTLIRPAFYGSHHEIIPVKLDSEKPEVVADIVGQLCESGDVVGKMRTIQKLDEGNYVAILDAGAYGFAMSSTYNSRPRPAEILISKDQKVEIIRKRETFEDLLRGQHIPDRLK
jgi:diaminopimelate decarboxylase